MTTTTTVSEARTMGERLARLGATNEQLPVLGIPAPSAVSHHNYAVGYYADKSILIWARGEGLLVLDAETTYFRDTVEHLARCLGTFTKEQRAAMIGRNNPGSGADVWIDGIRWASDGSYSGM